MLFEQFTDGVYSGKCQVVVVGGICVDVDFLCAIFAKRWCSFGVFDFDEYPNSSCHVYILLEQLVALQKVSDGLGGVAIIFDNLACRSCFNFSYSQNAFASTCFTDL